MSGFGTMPLIPPPTALSQLELELHHSLLLKGLPLSKQFYELEALYGIGGVVCQQHICPVFHIADLCRVIRKYSIYSNVMHVRM